MALTTVTVHGQILDPDGLTPAVGTVTFRTLIELRDTVDNVVYTPAAYVATLDLAGEFTIVVPATDNPDLVPASWVYQVYVSTETWAETIYVQIPFQVGTVEFSDLTPLAYNPCSPAVLDPPAPFDLSLFVLRSGDTMTGTLIVNQDVFVGDDLNVADQFGVAGLAAFGADVAFNADVHVAGDLTVVGTITGSIDAAQITSGTLPYQRLGGTIAEGSTVTFNRATLVTPGTAADVWSFTYNGTRVTYVNEYACLRVRGIDQVQTPARFMSHLNRDGTTLPTFQVSLSDAVSHVFQVLANGDILAAGGLSMLPTAPQLVTFTGAAAAATLISDGATTGAPYVLSTTLHAAANRVYMDGAVVNNGGAPIAGGTVLFTVTAAHRPLAWEQFNARTSTTLSARVTIRPDGTVRLDQPLAVGATCSFGGMNWRKG
jgi:hypothetical protein